MSQMYKLKENVGSHYTPPEKQGDPPTPMKPGTKVKRDDIPNGARDKFELVEMATGEEGEKVERVVVNNLEMVDEGSGKYKVVHRKTRVAVHDGYLTFNEANDLMGGEAGTGFNEGSRKKPKRTRRKAENV